MTVFISHASSRKEAAQHVAHYLERHGISSWYAPRDIPYGSQWDKSIAEAIGSASALILLFCAEADGSQHVHREVGLADQAQIPIFWLRLEDVQPDNLRYFLQLTQWIDWLDNRDATLETLVTHLQNDAPRATPSITPIEPTHPNRSAASSEIRSRPPWPRKIFAFETERLAGECVARAYIEIAKRSDDYTLLLPTGRASTKVFQAITRIARSTGAEPFGEAHIMNDTETFGVWPGHPTSRTRHVREELIEPLSEIGLAPSERQIHLLSGLVMEEDPRTVARKFLRKYPPSIHAVSVAPNGEILAFEVGTHTDSEALADSNVDILQLNEYGRGYIDPDQPSRSVLSVGIGTCLTASTLLILGFPGNKSNILRRIVEGPEIAGIPATILARHHNAYIVCTRSIAEEAGLLSIAETLTTEEAATMIAEGAHS